MLICSPVAVAAAASAQDTIGILDQVNGAAQIDRDGQTLNATSSMALKLHDKVDAKLGASVSIALGGGARLTLAESSTIVIDNQSFANQHGGFLINLSTGLVRASVVSEPSATVSGFEVHTPNAIAIAHGTEFAITYIANKACPDAPGCRRYTDVSVYKGIVEVINPTDAKNQRVRVQQGYETAVPCEFSPTSPAPIGMNELGAPGYQ